MKRKLIAVVFLVAMTLVLNLPLMGHQSFSYGYAFSKVGSSAEEIALFEVGALALAFAIGPAGWAFAGAYGLATIA